MFIRSISRARRRVLVAGGIAATAVACGVATAAAGALPANPWGTTHVGTQTDGSVMLPDGAKVNPFGQRTQFTAQTVGHAISPDATKIAVQTGGVASGARHLNIVDASTGAILQSFGGGNYVAPAYSPDGTALYSAAGTSTVYKYTVDPSTGLVTNPTEPQTLALPGGGLPVALAVSADGSTLYAALSTGNKLAVINAATLQLVTSVGVGAAPAALAIVGNEAFVPNRGGKIAAATDTSNTSAGTRVEIDPATGATTNGTVSVVDLSTDTVADTIEVGLQPNSVTMHDGSLFVTNSNDDTVSIIDAASHKVMQTVNVAPQPGSSVGASPNSVTFAGDHTMLVSVGGDNAIAQFGYNGPTQPVDYQGLIPTDWYPNQVSYDATLNKVFVSNEYGIGTNGGTTTSKVIGTETAFAPPSGATLDTLTSQVFDNNGWNGLNPSNPAAGNGNNQAEQNANGQGLPAIPKNLGQPSAIKHVFLIVKENRPYDQVLGDLGKGNGEPANATYGAQVTPNSHSVANTFTTFDNFYNPGEQSADGNIWVNQAEPNDYLAQKQADGFTRNANGQLALDPLNIQRTGYIWSPVLAAGKSVRLFGETDGTVTGQYGTWQQYYADSQILEGKASDPLPVAVDSFQDHSEIPAGDAILNHNFPTFNTNIPDQYRVDMWHQDFQQELATNSVPNFTFMSLVDDHTGGLPTARAQVADNDLAMGRVIDEISHSSVWKDSLVIVEEDDTQSGADHVDGHRGPLFIASPFAKRGAVDSSYYSVLNVDKTIEQILGAQPMNHYDRAAVPMFDAFTDTPDYTPYDALQNQIPLTEGVGNLIPLTPTAATAASPTAAAAVTATSGPAAPAVPAAEQSVAAAWDTWAKTVAQPMVSGPGGVRDSTNPAQLNRYDWYTGNNWSQPYPGDTTILAPDEVPGRNLPSDMSGD